MAKKEENFDFDTESKAKVSLNFSFFKNLTQKQKETILMIAIAVVAVIVIVVIGVLVMTGGNGDSNGSNTGEGGSPSGDNNTGDEGDDDQVPEGVRLFNIASAPTKTVYFVGDELDCTGMELHYRDASNDPCYVNYEDDPDAFEITGFDSSVPVEQQVITVTCQGMSDTFVIEIKAVESETPKLVSIHFSTYPKQIYSVDDKFSYLDAVLTCTYSDGNTKDIELIPEYMYGVGDVFDPSDDHILLPGEHTIQIEYYEDGVFVQTEYTITVTE